VTALLPSELLVVHRTHFDEALLELVVARTRSVLEFIRSLSPFAAWSDGLALKLASLLTERSFDDGAVVARAAAAALDNVLIVRRGRLRLQTASEEVVHNRWPTPTPGPGGESDRHGGHEVLEGRRRVVRAVGSVHTGGIYGLEAMLAGVKLHVRVSAPCAAAAAAAPRRAPAVLQRHLR
jgi:hypothetical protein